MKETLKAIAVEEDTTEKITNETQETVENPDDDGQAKKVRGKQQRRRKQEWDDYENYDY